MISFSKFLINEEVKFNLKDENEKFIKTWYEEALKFIPSYYKKLVENQKKAPSIIDMYKINITYKSVSEFSADVQKLSKNLNDSKKICDDYTTELNKWENDSRYGVGKLYKWNSIERFYKGRRNKERVKDIKDLIDMKISLDKSVTSAKYSIDDIKKYYDEKAVEITKADNATKKIKIGTSAEDVYKILKNYGFRHDRDKLASGVVAGCYENMYFGPSGASFCYLGFSFKFFYGKLYTIKNGKVSNIKEILKVTDSSRETEKLHKEFEAVQPGGADLSSYYDGRTWTGD